MKPRGLRSDEKGPVLRALLDSGIASPAVCHTAVDICRFIPFDHFLPPVTDGLRPLIAYFALRRRASGITLGDHVYVRRNLFDRRGKLPLFLVTHEVAHVVQFIRDGTAPFLTRYLGEYAFHRLRGIDDRRAYLAISYEREARRVESFLDK